MNDYRPLLTALLNKVRHLSNEEKLEFLNTLKQVQEELISCKKT